MQQPICVAVDFDGTLAYFKGGYDELFAIFSRRGVDPAMVRECYERTKREFGFSISAMIKVVERETGCSLNRDEIVREFLTWLEDSLIAYADSVLRLAKWQQERIPVVILTTGDAEYQAQKVQATWMPHDELLVVAQDKEKPGKVRQLLEQYGEPILLIEDQPSVLDLVRENGLSKSEVVTVRLMRPESRYFLEKSKYSHAHCDTLEDVHRLWN